MANIEKENNFIVCHNCGGSVKFCPQCGQEIKTGIEDEEAKIPMDTTQDDIRMIVYGMNGAGVSSTANTIIGEQVFKTGLSFDEMTTSCKMEEREQCKSTIKIVDTPGFQPDAISSKMSLEEAFSGIKNAIEMLLPGPNVFILVIPIDKFTKKNSFMFNCLKVLGKISQHTVVVFNKLSEIQHDKETIRQKVSQSQSLRELLSFANDRFELFDNHSNDKKQVERLFAIIRRLMNDNNSAYFDISIFNHIARTEFSQAVLQYEETWNEVKSDKIF